MIDSLRDDVKQSDDFEQQFEDLDTKVVLVQILTELQQIRLLLSEATGDAPRDSDAPTTYQCTKCPATVPADGRERHARAEHNAPAGMEAALFEKVER